MSPKFNKIREYYDVGFWNKTMIRNAVIKGWITEGEYTLITGEEL